jgi:hypothetical protein
MGGKVHYLGKSLPINTLFWIYTGASIRLYKTTQVDAAKITDVVRK